jgi:deoxyribonuclease-4
MPLFGAHLSVAGGHIHAIEAAIELQCDTVQLFTASPSQWSAKPIIEADAIAFRKRLKDSKLKYATAHDSYLINLAAPDDALWEKSKAAFTSEIERAEMLGLSYLVTHPGAHVGSGEDAGLKRIAAALDDVLDATAGAKVKVLLEATAGQGSTLGHRFEHLQYLLENTRHGDRLGICVDTCHIFAAGYDLRDEHSYHATFDEFDDLIGIKRIDVFHLNDSVKGLGAKVDRHAGIGLGQIGEAAFRLLINDKRFAKKPMILETPKEDAAGNAMDPVNLAKLRSFLT